MSCIPLLQAKFGFDPSAMNPIFINHHTHRHLAIKRDIHPCLELKCYANKLLYFHAHIIHPNREIITLKDSVQPNY